MSGFWCFLFLGRWSMVLGWRDLFKRKMLKARSEFVSADARMARRDQRAYEMIDSSRSTPALDIAPPSQAVLSPSARSPSSPDSHPKSEYFGRITIETNYVAPTSNYSSPMTPVNRVQRTDWNSKGNGQHFYKFKDYGG